MKKKIVWMVWCCVCCLLVGSCSNEEDVLWSNQGQAGVPVSFTAACPRDMAGKTRMLEDKSQFGAGDAIHVSAIFTLEDNTRIIKYATLTWDNGEWVNLSGEKDQDMTWPWNARSGRFTAYYLKEWNGAIVKTGEWLSAVVLDRFEYEREEDKTIVAINPDPLKAESVEVEYGHAVHLEFSHLCTRLTITGVRNEDELWLKSVDDNQPLKSACTMMRKEDNTLDFEFVTEESAKVAAPVYQMEGKNAVTFHLADGDYSSFKLTRRNGYSYLTISAVKELKTLDAGKAYTVSIEKLAGNITQDDWDDNWWDGDEPEVPEYEEFDATKFMDAISKCTEDYNCKMNNQNITLLKKDDKKREMRLQYDVDFKYADFVSVDLSDAVTFDGGGKSIKGVAHPLFSNLHGTVKNLVFWNARLNNEEDKDTDTMTEWGVLASICERGTVENVHLVGTEIDVTIRSKTEKDKSYNVGALVGWVKSGQISQVTLMDKVSVTVRSEYELTPYSVFVGGVIGQCSGMLYDITNEKNLQQPLIQVTNTCTGHGTRYTGGIIGMLTNGAIINSEVYTSVSSVEAGGSWNYTGGAVGSVRADNQHNATIAGLTVSGTTIGGPVSKYESLSSHSSTGGIVGYVKGASVQRNLALNSVSINSDYATSDDNTYYTIGGVIGSIDGAEQIDGNEGYGKFNATIYSKEKHYHAGTFAGAGSPKLQEDNKANGTGDFIGYEYRE